MAGESPAAVIVDQTGTYLAEVGPDNILLTRRDQREYSFSDEDEITVTHNLGLRPLNVRVFGKQQGIEPIGSYGSGGYGEGGYGSNVTSPYAGAGAELTGFTVIHVSENEFKVFLQNTSTGVVIYWI